MMNTHTLDILVTHLLQCSCNGVMENKSQCDNTALIQRTPIIKQPYITSFQIPDAWNSILNQILLSKCSTVITVPRPFVSSTWREIRDRKVLAPLPIKQNCDNLIPSSSLGMQIYKKPSLVLNEFLDLNKSLKTEVINHMRPCKVLLKRSSLRSMYIEYKCLNTKSFVKLSDVFKEIPQIKQEEKPVEQVDFMLSLNLFGNSGITQRSQAEIKTSHPIKFVNYHQIPFSSDYGRHLVLKDRHCVPEDVVLRKLDRTEWYLRTSHHSRRTKPLQLDVTYNKRIKKCHRFKFPKRQLYQNHQNLKMGFLQYICRPLCVKVIQMDLNAAIKAQQERNKITQMIEEIPIHSVPVMEEVTKNSLPIIEEMTETEELTDMKEIINIEVTTDKDCVPTSIDLEQINYLHIGSEHLISNNNSDSVIVSDETIEQPVLYCSCGEELTTPSLPECTKETVRRKYKKRKVKGIIRRSLRLMKN